MNIWFNRWFSTVSHYIDMIKNNPDGRKFTIYGTYPNMDAIYLKHCDVAGIEPDIKGEEYIDFCLDYCKSNGISVFIPRKENVLISKNLQRFEDIGVKVLVCPNIELMSMMDNKLEMYKDLENKLKNGKNIVSVPKYKIVNNGEEFKNAYKELTSDGSLVCIKPVVGEGACGFRIIDNYVENIDYLWNTAGSQRMSFNQAYNILSSVDRFNDLMVLEYLDGTEYSVDCLSDRKGKLRVAIPRKKGNGRIRELENNEELLEMAKSVAKEYKIPYVFNIQVRYKDGVPKLLEINPRMSGGLHISCLSGVNIPYNALKLLLDGEVETLNPKFGIRATHIEQSVLM